MKTMELMHEKTFKKDGKEHLRVNPTRFNESGEHVGVDVVKGSHGEGLHFHEHKGARR